MDDLEKMFHMQNNDLPIHERKTKYRVKRIDDEEELFQATESFYMNGLGCQESVEQTVYEGDCGHYIGFQNSSELGGRCAFCHSTLCFRCAQLRCQKCLELLCVKCAWVVDSAAVYCAFHRGLLAAKKGIKSFHEFCKKDFTK